MPAAQDRNAAGPRFVVVLDAAHGGDDPGARLSNGQQEKAYTLALSVRLRSLLMARGIAVVTTRESDTTVDADRRAEIANHANAQACLSLHGVGKRLRRAPLCLFAGSCSGRAFSALEDRAGSMGSAQPVTGRRDELGARPRRHDRDPGPHRPACD